MTPNENTQAEREDILQDLHNELYRAQTTDNPVVLLEAVGRARLLLSRYRAALSAPPAAECDHEWVSARNKYVTSGEICAKLCGAIRAEQPAADEHEAFNAGCTQALRAAGKAYLRTCAACKLGPCKFFKATARAAPAAASGRYEIAEPDALAAQQAPAQPPRQGGARGLTDDQIADLWMYRKSLHDGNLMLQLRDFARAIERAHGIGER